MGLALWNVVGLVVVFNISFCLLTPCIVIVSREWSIRHKSVSRVDYDKVSHYEYRCPLPRLTPANTNRGLRLFILIQIKSGALEQHLQS